MSTQIYCKWKYTIIIFTKPVSLTEYNYNVLYVDQLRWQVCIAMQ